MVSACLPSRHVCFWSGSAHTFDRSKQARLPQGAVQHTSFWTRALLRGSRMRWQAQHCLSASRWHEVNFTTVLLTCNLRALCVQPMRAVFAWVLLN